MYDIIINRLSRNKSEVYSDYIKLCIPEIITMLIISFVKVFDKVIANLIGVEVITGISMAAGYSEVMLLIGVAVKTVALIEYTKTKDLKLLGTMYKFSFVVQIFIVIGTIMVGNLLTYNSGLSLEAKSISSISLLAYGVYYILVDYNKFIRLILIVDKRTVLISKITTFSTVFNVLFDLVVYIIGLQWYWLVLDNIITELICILITRFILKDKKMLYGKINTIYKYKNSIFSTIIDSGARRVLYVLMTFILSWLGDVRYARYIIITSIIDQLINPTFSNVAFTGILLNDNYDKNDVRGVICKFSIKYALFCSLLSLPLSLLFKDGNISYLLLIILTGVMTLVNSIQSYYTGLNRYNNLYNSISKAQIVCTISSLLWLAFSVLVIGNEYVAYLVWIIRNIINITLLKMYYKRFAENNCL